MTDMTWCSIESFQIVDAETTGAMVSDVRITMDIGRRNSQNQKTRVGRGRPNRRSRDGASDGSARVPNSECGAAGRAILGSSRLKRSRNQLNNGSRYPKRHVAAATPSRLIASDLHYPRLVAENTASSRVWGCSGDCGEESVAAAVALSHASYLTIAPVVAFTNAA
jgi:hypothetical protein